ncbi:hypothetical protein [Nocardioides sp.]|uniref:hypothetical protein n=1 Tax=Nocardioides sp. TaxID=35761 RepID=UPI002623FDDD|nr:hypothetical protein [Nocardioides sp.]MDI6908457.1 hypothetical protein [Nocardioides sp.]
MVVVSEQQVRKRPRHLMDPDNLRREIIRPTGPGVLALEPVQRWVLSVLAATTIGHLAAGLVIAALTIEESRPGAQVGLSVLAGAFGVLAVVVSRVIHQKRFLSPWLLLGLVPAIVGLVLVRG